MYLGGDELTSAGPQDGVTAEVGDLDHHAVVDHTVGGLEATVDLDVTGVEIGHALYRHGGGGHGCSNRYAAAGTQRRGQEGKWDRKGKKTGGRWSSSSPRTISLLVFEAKLAEGASNALMYLGKKRGGETRKGTHALVLSEAAEVNQVIPPVSSHQKQSSVTLVDFL
ncbi:hypothetical protein EYF80_034131 [Liparis tanakae]|uniref:Uncharacterized protein n=1 Tax=Liparis tanakae TaxID=230148 RepID=A0A4Z2GR77_9TELE|nr:hypothetical protein EYF80_034131 [Liparis tanakae]